MTNEEKAHRICETIKSIYGVDIAQEAHIYSAALEAMQWKDEQFAEEKKAWLDKATDFFAIKHIGSFDYSTLDMINDFVEYIEK